MLRDTRPVNGRDTVPLSPYSYKRLRAVCIHLCELQNRQSTPEVPVGREERVEIGKREAHRGLQEAGSVLFLTWVVVAQIC